MGKDVFRKSTPAEVDLEGHTPQYWIHRGYTQQKWIQMENSRRHRFREAHR